MNHLLDVRMRLKKLSHGQAVLHVLQHPQFERFQATVDHGTVEWRWNNTHSFKKKMKLYSLQIHCPKKISCRFVRTILYELQSLCEIIPVCNRGAHYHIRMSIHVLR